MNYENFLKVENFKKEVEQETNLSNLQFYHIGGGFYAAEGTFQFNGKKHFLVVISDYFLIFEDEVFDWESPLIVVSHEGVLDDCSFSTFSMKETQHISSLGDLYSFIEEKDLYNLIKYYLLRCNVRN